MSARYTLAGFKSAGIEPGKCDGTPYDADDADGGYWFACSYHEGYIDGYGDAGRTA